MAGSAAALLAVIAGQMLDGHVHRAPHGGVVAHLGKDHLEVVVMASRIEAWLLDEKEAVLPPRGVLSRTVEVGALPPKRLTLGVAEGRFMLNTRLDLEPMKIAAELRVGNKIARTELRWTPLDARDRLVDPVMRKDRTQRE